MMRASLPIALATVLAVLSMPSVAAQGCEETVACPIVIDVDENGLGAVEQTTFTLGDWYYLDLFNHDDVEHTVTLEGYDVSVTIVAGDPGTSDGFQFDEAGDFTLMDDPSGDSVEFTVIEGDSVEDDENTDPGRETDDDDSDTPGLGPVPIIVTVLGVAMVMMRRRP